MFLSKIDEIIHVWADGIHSTLHGWNRIGLSLKSNPATPNSPELLVGNPGGSSPMIPLEITTEYKYLVLPQLSDTVRCECPIILAIFG